MNKHANYKILGFDLDGVLCDISLIDLTMIHKHGDVDANYYYIERKPLLNPKMFMHEYDKAVCITARPSQFHKITKRWMKKHYPNIPVYFFDVDLHWSEKGAVAAAKVEYLKELGVQVYYDDDPEIIQNMRAIEENIMFIQYGGRLAND